MRFSIFFFVLLTPQTLESLRLCLAVPSHLPSTSVTNTQRTGEEEKKKRRRRSGGCWHSADKTPLPFSVHLFNWWLWLQVIQPLSNGCYSMINSVEEVKGWGAFHSWGATLFANNYPIHTSLLLILMTASSNSSYMLTIYFTDCLSLSYRILKINLVIIFIFSPDMYILHLGKLIILICSGRNRNTRICLTIKANLNLWLPSEREHYVFSLSLSPF